VRSLSVGENSTVSVRRYDFRRYLFIHDSSSRASRHSNDDASGL
jgi:hypothetical protein